MKAVEACNSTIRMKCRLWIQTFDELHRALSLPSALTGISVHTPDICVG